MSGRAKEAGEVHDMFSYLWGVGTAKAGRRDGGGEAGVCEGVCVGGGGGGEEWEVGKSEESGVRRRRCRCRWMQQAAAGAAGVGWRARTRSSV